MMDEYAALDVTARAKDVVKSIPLPPQVPFGSIGQRRLQRRGLAAEGKVAARNLRCISYGETEVELSCVEQLVEISQARAIGDCLQLLGDEFASRSSDGRLRSCGGQGNPLLLDVLEELEHQLQAKGRPVGEQGLDLLSRFREPCPFYVMPRRLEVAAALNRLRTAQMTLTA